MSRYVSQVSFFQTTSNNSILRPEIPNEIIKKRIEPINQQILPQRAKEELAILHPSTFCGLSVVVSLAQQGEQIAIEKALRQIGANILQEFQPLVDAIITDRKVKQNPPTVSRSRGSKMTESIVTKMSSPRIINPSQIPWIFDKVEPAKEAASSPQEEVVPSVVVTDLKSISRPLYKPISRMPQMHFAPVPKGYLFSPFSAPPQDPTQFMQKYESYKDSQNQDKLDGPADNGFCELCGCSFHIAKSHRESSEHIRKASKKSLWNDFDEISKMFSKNDL